MYLDYTEYLSYGGNVDAQQFPRLNYIAHALLDRYTQKRVQRMETVPESAKRCLTELVNGMGATDPVQAATQAAVTSFSNDGYSETYLNPTTAQSLEMGFVAIMQAYLSATTDDKGTPLLYMGVDA